MLQRIIGILTLNKAVYQEIEHDESATTQAAIVVAIVALFSGVGGGFAANMTGGNFVSGFIGSLILAFVGWLIWSAVTYFVGTTVFDGQATFTEMLRMIGFAQAPLLLGIIPCVGIIGLIWALVTGFYAIREGLDLDNMKSAITIVIGWIIYFVGSLLIGGAAGLVSSIGG